MKILIVEDDFTSQQLLSGLLRPFGKIDVVVEGKDAVESVQGALKKGQPYDLICLDIMMPNMSGQEALKKIRNIEKENGIEGLDCSKVIMTTALGDKENIMQAFSSQCESYLVKPIGKDKLIEEMTTLGLM